MASEDLARTRCGQIFGPLAQLEREYPNTRISVYLQTTTGFSQNDKLLLESQICTLCRMITCQPWGVSVRVYSSTLYLLFSRPMLPDSASEAGIRKS